MEQELHKDDESRCRGYKYSERVHYCARVELWYMGGADHPLLVQYRQVECSLISTLCPRDKVLSRGH
jgi:hypothetical protein